MSKSAMMRVLLGYVIALTFLASLQWVTVTSCESFAVPLSSSTSIRKGASVTVSMKKGRSESSHLKSQRPLQKFDRYNIRGGMERERPASGSEQKIFRLTGHLNGGATEGPLQSRMRPMSALFDTTHPTETRAEIVRSGPLLEWYTKKLHQAPLLTKMVTSGKSGFDILITVLFPDACV
jgi:hypothetical protein